LGDPRAQAALSDLYLRGIGVQRDYVRAYTWASIAGRLGGEGERLVTLRQRMTRSELEDANRRVQTWFHAQTLSR
jgi:TPR repeat protein